MAFSGSARVAVNGGDELAALLKKAPIKMVKKHLRRAMSLASSPVLKSQKAAVNTDTGLLKKSLSRKIKLYPKSNVVAAIIGPRSDMWGQRYGKRARPAWYAHLTEGGTKPHTITPKGKFLAIPVLKNLKGVASPDLLRFRTRARHPGSTGKGWVRRSVDVGRTVLVGKVYTTMKDGLLDAFKQISSSDTHVRL